MKKLPHVLAATLLISGVCFDASARDSSNKDSKQSMDESFVLKASQDNLAEIKLGELAQQKGGTQATKDFGQMLVQDHSAANEKLKAAAKGMKVASEPSPKQKDTYARLSKLSGGEFDRSFSKEMVNDHKKAIELFEKETKSQNSDLNQFASEILPKLKEHLQHAESLAQQK